MSLQQELTTAAETEWLGRWTAGPTEPEGPVLPTGTRAPDLVLLDHTGAERSLSEFWDGQPALVMFWRHFGCGCGFDRARRLNAEMHQYFEAGLLPVIIGQGEPARAAAYRAEHELPCTILCDPDFDAYRAYGIGHWNIERVLPDAPPQFWDHTHDTGVEFQTARRATGQPLVDDPWRAVKEFVVGANGRIRLTYSYQWCENFPDPQLLTTAARLS
ncbi:MAG: peroxiredoxin-like family protein [Ilumatobacteraceae bacterium]